MFKQMLKRARESANITQQGLADRIVAILNCKLSRQAVQKWEDGVNYPEDDKWSAIDSALGVGPGWTESMIRASREIGSNNASARDIDGDFTVGYPVIENCYHTTVLGSIASFLFLCDFT